MKIIKLLVILALASQLLAIKIKSTAQQYDATSSPHLVKDAMKAITKNQEDKDFLECVTELDRDLNAMMKLNSEFAQVSETRTVNFGILVNIFNAISIKLSNDKSCGEIFSNGLKEPSELVTISASVKTIYSKFSPENFKNKQNTIITSVISNRELPDAQALTCYKALNGNAATATATATPTDATAVAK